MDSANSDEPRLLPTGSNKLPNSTCAMRKRTLFAGIFVLLICVALLLNKAFRQRPSDSLPLDPGQTNTQTVARPSEIQPARNAQSFHVQDSVSLSSQRPETERSNAIWQEIQADWQKPIDFYGRVLDEKSNSVQGASIRFQWADRSEDEHIATGISVDEC